MIFDIIPVTSEDLDKYSSMQMQLLRNAQKKKNELQHNMEKEVQVYADLLRTHNMHNSALLEQKKAALNEEFEYEVDILREQLLYSIALNEPYPEPGEGEGDVGYIVDYSLSYTDRYAIVRAYYLSIEDPVERMNRYTNDETARRYLGNYYSTLYNVLYTYSL